MWKTLEQEFHKNNKLIYILNLKFSGIAYETFKNEKNRIDKELDLDCPII